MMGLAPVVLKANAKTAAATAIQGKRWPAIARSIARTVIFEFFKAVAAVFRVGSIPIVPILLEPACKLFMILDITQHLPHSKEIYFENYVWNLSTAEFLFTFLS